VIIIGNGIELAIEAGVHEIAVFGQKTRVRKPLGKGAKYAFLQPLRGGFDRRHACSTIRVTGISNFT